MDLSFVILSWNSKRHLQRCLPSIMTSLDGEKYKYEVFIIDNGSKDGSVEFINDFNVRYPSLVKPMFLERNRGTTYSRNLALKKATGKYIVILDSDVELKDGVVEKLTAFLENNRSAGMVVPKLLYGNGALQKSTDDFPTFISKLYRYFFLKALEKRENQSAREERARRVDYAISAFWVVRREVREKVGLFDENLFYAPDDVDYCLRIWKSGYEILYVPQVYAIHYAQEISRGFKLNKALLEHVKGLVYYFIKHRYCFRKPRFY